MLATQKKNSKERVEQSKQMIEAMYCLSRLVSCAIMTTEEAELAKDFELKRLKNDRMVLEV